MPFKTKSHEIRYRCTNYTAVKIQSSCDCLPIIMRIRKEWICPHAYAKQNDMLQICYQEHLIPNKIFQRMVSSGMLRRVVLVRTDVSEEISASFIRVTRIKRSVRRLLVTASVVPSSPILVTLMKEALSSYKSHTA
jgi:hypothetical protein